MYFGFRMSDYYGMIACFSADNFMYISLTNYITIESYKINPVFNHVTNVKLQLAYLIALW